MVVTLPELTDSDRATTQLTVVLSGSYRRDPEGLQRTFERLRSRYTVLSPASVEFTDPSAEFVRLPWEADESTMTIESRHLQSMRNADFVWLFDPDGYVGTSSALEVGYAFSVGIPVFSDTKPSDELLAAMVTIVSDTDRMDELVAPRPGEALAALQDYYRRIAARRGWAEESPKDTLLLITEEIGELARAIRKSSGLKRDGSYPDTPVAEELADVQLYLVHLASALGVDLAEAVTEKERKNAQRHALRPVSAA